MVGLTSPQATKGDFSFPKGARPVEVVQRSCEFGIGAQILTLTNFENTGGHVAFLWYWPVSFDET